MVQFLISNRSQLESLNRLLNRNGWSLEDTGKTDQLSGAASAAGSIVHIYNIKRRIVSN